MKRILTVVCLAAVILSHTALARSSVGPHSVSNDRQDKAEPVKKPESTDTALRTRAYELLESLATQVSTLQSAENRARIGANIADSLWKHDEKRARAVFTTVAEDIKLQLQKSVEEEQPTDHERFEVFFQLRSDTVERIAKFDAEFAYDFLKTTEPVYDDSPTPALVERERAMEMRLAKQIVGSDPQLALKLGHRSLAIGFAQDLLPLLKQLHRKHRETGVTLYKAVVGKLSDANLAEDEATLQFAKTLATSLAPPVADEMSYRDLFNIFIKTALANNCHRKTEDGELPDFCRQIQPLIEQMIKVEPLRAARLQHLQPESDTWEVVRQLRAEMEDLVENGTVDELLALAQKYPQMNSEISWRAMMMAQRLDDVERARKIANDFNGEPELRQRMLNALDSDEATNSIKDEELAQAQSALDKMTRLEERIFYLVSLANRVGTTNRAMALKFLDQAMSAVDTMKPGKDLAEVRMGMAMMYCVEKSDRGLSIMESLMPKLNELIDAAAKLDGYDTRYLRDGEWNMSANGTLGNLLTSLSQNAAYFAWCDFDRAVSVAAQFDRAEIRMMAQVKLAQAIIAGAPKRYRVEPALIY